MNARVLILLLLVAVPARAAPYVVAYEGDVFPEEAGWERRTWLGGAERTVENGIFTLMARNPGPDGGSDQYVFDMQDQLDPDPGEFFFAEWRMRLVPGSDSSDVGVNIARDSFLGVFHSFYSVNAYRTLGVQEIVYLDTTQWHTYRFESLDMYEYTMSIDGQLAWEAFFLWPTGVSSQVGFGDLFIFSASGSQWDYFRFGVVTVPEPAPVALLVGTVFARRRSRQTGSLNSGTEQHSEERT